MSSMKWKLMGLALLVCNAANAESPAQLLKQLCESKEPPAKLSCISYIYGYRMGHQQGISEVLIGARLIVDIAPNDTVEQAEHKSENGEKLYAYICIPKGVTNQQIADLFLKHMSKHPEKLQVEQSYVLSDLLMQQYPCRK